MNYKSISSQTIHSQINGTTIKLLDSSLRWEYIYTIHLFFRSQIYDAFTAEDEKQKLFISSKKFYDIVIAQWVGKLLYTE